MRDVLAARATIKSGLTVRAEGGPTRKPRLQVREFSAHEEGAREVLSILERIKRAATLTLRFVEFG